MVDLSEHNKPFKGRFFGPWTLGFFARNLLTFQTFRDQHPGISTMNGDPPDELEHEASPNYATSLSMTSFHGTQYHHY